ncbi:aminodeoxychorismate synthase component I [Ochrobactrum sp. SFR4]|uniref:aminodeoxychorismate synthase component I n=1 Tax=Ochrobactrum sp. SFR4 TaxID=2717368 RepID=UPI001C8BE988|nr:aminodeoxychorismate synthase component I [Ochrobactrum sp. SFR4]MBX8825210.1 aminodeoxychorismate synthase component I [Ochrobactrum sp. SFR4]
MPASSEPFILFRDNVEQQSMLFNRPEQLIIIEQASDFEAGFAALEAAHRQGKWLAGYFSYEAGFLLEPKLAPLLPEKRRVPLICFGVFSKPPADIPVGNRNTHTNAHLSDFHAHWSEADYQQRFERLHRHLREGDCYQGNLTFPISARYQGEPEALFAGLSNRQPVRYSAYVNLTTQGKAPLILSRSPELFFQINKDGWIETHPMKGTTPRGTTPQEDDALRDFLIHDEKSQAENRMIVDLLRNDISLISEVGSLSVPKLFHVERYPTVHQMVSHVRAKLLPDLTLRQIFAALFPCGSVTGAPKISAMTILHKLEQQARDIYCGSIGWIAPSGEMRFNVAIRTLSLYPDGEAVLNVGGGVVYDSTAEAEYAECLLKARYATGDNAVSGTHG